MDYFDWGDYATNPDWTSGFDLPDITSPSDWTSGYDLPDGTTPGGGGWTSGYDLPGGGDTGLPVGPGGSFNVGPGQKPSDVYNRIISGGGFTPGGPNAGTGGTSIGDLVSGLDWKTLLPIIAAIGGGLYARNRTGKATEQIIDSINRASADATATLGGAKSLYAPYQAAGLEGLNRLTAFPQSNFASRYRPLGTGAGMTLGALTGGR